MAHLNYFTGQWEDDDKGPAPLEGGSLGAQAALPPVPAAAPPAPPPAPPPPPAVLPGVGPVARPPGNPGLATRVEMTTPERENLAALDTTNVALKETAGKQGEIDVQKAERAAAEADAIAEKKAQQAAEAAELKQQHDAIIQQRQATDRQEYDKWRSMGIKDPQADESFGHKMMRALAIGLGQYSASKLGGTNMAAQIFADDRAQNIALQRDNIEKQKEASIKAGADAKQAQDNAREQMHLLNLKNAAQVDAFRDRWKAESLKLGIPEARVNADKNTLLLDKQAEEARAKVLESGRTRITDLTPQQMRQRGTGTGGGGGKGLDELIAMKEDGAKDSDIAKRAAQLGIAPKNYLPSLREVRAGDAVAARGAGGKPTEAQTKAAVYGRAIEDAVKQVGDAAVLTPAILAKFQRNSLQSESADASASKGLISGAGVGIGRAVGLVAKSKYDGIPEAAQTALNAIDVAKESLARVHSGGAIPTAEDRAFADLWAPKSGDSPKLIAQKLRQMDTEAKRLLALSGGAAKMTEGITNTAPGTPAAKPGPAAPKASSEAEQAKAIVNDPSKRKLYTAPEWAQLIKAARGG